MKQEERLMDGKWGYINANGEPVSPCRWDQALGFRSGKAIAARDGKKYTIDETGAVISG